MANPGPCPWKWRTYAWGPMSLRRQFVGSLESAERINVAPKVGGQVLELPLKLGDAVKRGDVLVRLDDAEYAQALEQAKAELAVADASAAQARSAAQTAERSWQRSVTLADRGVASESALDTATAEKDASASAVLVAEADVLRARAALGVAQVRLDYTTLHANWPEGDPDRVVGEVMVETGDTVAANTPLLTLVSLDPIRAVIFATEADYAQLSPGKAVTVTTDAYPGQSFVGHVARVAPVFVQASRQARVELAIENPDRRLRPGMFVRIQTVLQQIDQARAVPEDAITRRDDHDVIFLVGPDGQKAQLRPVDLGVRDAGWVQVTSPDIVGRVVTLGQQLLSDGSAVTIAESDGSVTIPEAVAPAEDPTREAAR